MSIYHEQKYKVVLKISTGKRVPKILVSIDHDVDE